jgi:hypothetical protein
MRDAGERVAAGSAGAAPQGLTVPVNIPEIAAPHRAVASRDVMPSVL